MNNGVSCYPDVTDTKSRAETFDLERFQISAPKGILPNMRKNEEREGHRDSEPTVSRARTIHTSQRFTVITKPYSKQEGRLVVLEEYKPANSGSVSGTLVDFDPDIDSEQMDNSAIRSSEEVKMDETRKEELLDKLAKEIKPSVIQQVGNEKVNELLKEVFAKKNLPLIQQIVDSEYIGPCYKPHRAKIVHRFNCTTLPIVRRNSPLSFKVSLANCGTQSWPSITIFQCINGCFQESFVVGSVEAGSYKSLKITLKSHDRPGTYESLWRLTCPKSDSKKLEGFGPIFTFKFTVSQS